MTESDRTSRAMQRRRRRERIAGCLLAALGVAVLIVAVLAIRQQHNRGAAAGTPTATRTVTLSPSASGSKPATRSTSAAPTGSSSGTASSAAAKLPLVVLNNTTTGGLAKSAAQRFEAGGWTVTKYDNYQNDILSTCAYYDPSVAGAQASAQALQRQFPTIKRVEPQFADLASWHSPIVVILTPDYSPD